MAFGFLDKLFDHDRDGKLSFLEETMKNATIAATLDEIEQEEKAAAAEEASYNLLLEGLDEEELRNMYPWEREDALHMAGLDPEDYAYLDES